MGARPAVRGTGARQKPAYSLRTNVTDGTFVHKQMRLMHDVDED